MIRTKAMAVAAVASLTLTACGGGGGSGSGSDDPILIGLSTPLSGSTAGLGENEQNGVKLAIREINADGGVYGGRKLELTAEDNACNPTDGVSSVNKLITQEKASVLIGALCSGVTLAAMPIVQRSQVPMVVATSTSPDISKAAGSGGNKYTFRVNPPDDALAVAMVKYLAEAGTIGKVAILAEDSTYGRTGAKAFEDALKTAGIAVSDVDFVPLGTSDFSTQISKYKNEGAEAVALYISGADHLSFLRQAASANLGLPVTGRVELEGKNLEILKDPQFAGTTSVYPYNSQVGTPENAAFAKNYETAYGEPPTYESYEGYNATKVIADAIRRAKSSDPQAIQKALLKTDLPSLTGGKITFDEHNQAHDKAFILGLDGEEVVIESEVTT